MLLQVAVYMSVLVSDRVGAREKGRLWPSVAQALGWAAGGRQV